MTIYTLKTCDSCRKATKWLRANEFTFEEIPLRENPPSVPELERALADLDGDHRKLFNTSGVDYRALNMKEKLPALSVEEALNLLAANGNLVKRPLLIAENTTKTGFRPDSWASLLK